jgi:hypothetical protein
MVDLLLVFIHSFRIWIRGARQLLFIAKQITLAIEESRGLAIIEATPQGFAGLPSKALEGSPHRMLKKAIQQGRRRI